MKTKAIAVSFLGTCLLAGCISEKHPHHASQAQLRAEAKVSEADARATALARVQNGTIKEAEIEREHGKLIWSFDIAIPGSPDITEVGVDAMTGKVVAVEKETAEEQAKEKAENVRQGKKGEKDQP